jgi:NHLM bacteriocin system ABC transporter peptidase/ATP-binding protein
MTQTMPQTTTGAATAPRRRRTRTPTMIQMEASECGAASLGMVLAYYKRHVPLEQLRAICAVSRDGSNAANILRAARHFGLEAKGYRMDLPKLDDVPKPAIVYWEMRHFVVLEKVTRSAFGRGPRRFHLNDPATGPRVAEMKEFDGAYSGIVLTFAPGPSFAPGGRPSRFFDGLRDRIRGTRAVLTLIMLASLLLVVPGIATPAFSLVFIDRILGSGSTRYLVPLVIAMLAATVATLVLTAIQQNYLLRVETKVALASSAKFFRHLLRLPIDFINQRQPAEVARRVASNDVVAQILTRDLANTALNLLLVAFYSVLMIKYEVRLALISIAAALLNIVVLRAVARARKDAVEKLQAERGKLIATSFNTLQQIETIKAAGLESASFQRWAGFETKVVNTEQRLGVPSALLTVIPPTLATLNSALILLIGGLKAADGAISIGLLVAFQTLLNGFSRPVTQLTNLGGRIQEASAEVTRLRDVERYPLSPLFTQPALERPPARRLDGQLELRHVTFGYNPTAPPLLTDFSVVLQPGRRVAIVGRSGSGKSTVGKLIAGLYTPRSGEILFDGRTREQLGRVVTAASVAYVDQEIFLFEGTVRDNVTLWDRSINDDVVVAALRDAEIYDVISQRPGAIDSMVSEGGRNFSGGQRQRLEIARALATQPSLLVLDEATSALDARTERKIDDNLRRRGCACVIIAHRLSTIRDADQILVLENGQVVQVGRHEDLIALPGTYANLIASS